MASTDSDPQSRLNFTPKTPSFNYASQTSDVDLGTDRRFAFARQASFQRPVDPSTPASATFSRNRFSRTVSSIDIPPGFGGEDDWLSEKPEKVSPSAFLFSVFRGGTRPMRRLLLLITLNVAYSTTELLIGLLSARIGLVSDAFHLTFGCGLLTFSLYAMFASRSKADRVYTYGYKRLEVLAAFTNATALSSFYVIFLGRGSSSCIRTR